MLGKKFIKVSTTRKRLRAKRKSKGKDSYSSEAFDLSIKPEITNKKGRIAKSIENSDVLPSTSKGPTNTTRLY